MHKVSRIGIVESYQSLEGNPKLTVNFYPMFCIPVIMMSFYFSVYMKEMGVTDIQIGYLVPISNICTAIASVFCGNLIDWCGRKRFLFLVDGVAWPLILLLRFIGSEYWVFVLAAVIGNFASIGNIAFQFMLSEDVSDKTRMSGFNLVNIIYTGSGIFTLAAGFFVGKFGVVKAERGFLLLSMVSVFLMAVIRNHFYKETATGIEARKIARKDGFHLKTVISRDILRRILGDRNIRFGMLVNLSLYFCTLFGSMSGSMYYVPYLTERLGFDAATASWFGTILSVSMIVVSMLVVPKLGRLGLSNNIIIGAGVLAGAMLMVVTAPQNGFVWMLISNVLYGLGYGILKPNVDTMVATLVNGTQRASIYSALTLVNTLAGTLGGVIAGYIFAYCPVFLYVISMAILVFLILLVAGRRMRNVGQKRMWRFEARNGK